MESVPFLFLPHYADFAESAVEPEVSFGNAELRGVGVLNPPQSVGSVLRWFGAPVKGGKKVLRALRHLAFDHVLLLLDELCISNARA